MKTCQDPQWNHDTSALHCSESKGLAESAVHRVQGGITVALLHSGLPDDWDCDIVTFRICETEWQMVVRHHSNNAVEKYLMRRSLPLNLRLSISRTLPETRQGPAVIAEAPLASSFSLVQGLHNARSTRRIVFDLVVDTAKIEADIALFRAELAQLGVDMASEATDLRVVIRRAGSVNDFTLSVSDATWTKNRSHAHRSCFCHGRSFEHLCLTCSETKRGSVAAASKGHRSLWRKRRSKWEQCRHSTRHQPGMSAVCGASGNATTASLVRTPSSSLGLFNSLVSRTIFFSNRFGV